MLGWELPPYNTGGLGVACYELSKALAVRGVEIDFVVPYQDKHEDIDFMNILPALPCSYEWLCVNGITGYSNPGNAFASELSCKTNFCDAPKDLRDLQMRYTDAIKQIVKNDNYDAIHAHDWLTFEAAIQAKLHSKKPLIAHVHATEFDRAGASNGSPLVHEIEYNALMMADRIIAVSQATKDVIINSYQIPASKIDVVHNSINAAALAPLDDHNLYVYLERMKSHGYKVVVNVGRLTIQKGLTHLLKAAQLVIQKNSKILFLIAGTGEQYYELLQLSAELGISQNVIFTGQFVRGKAWRDAFAIGDMFVMPSVSEPFGIAPLEAMSYGTLALISKQSGVCEVLNNTLKFDYWDTQKLADYILAVAYYPSLRHELYQNAMQEFINMSWHKVAQKCHAVYDKTTMQGALI